MKFILNKILGSVNQKELARFGKITERINALEGKFKAMPDKELADTTARLKKHVFDKMAGIKEERDALIGKIEESSFAQEREKLKRRLKALKNTMFEGILEEAFALVRESAKRILGMRHFDVQLIGGLVIHEGKISEMATGEGKTLVATLPAYLNALAGEGVHIVTVNDYLAKRDREWMGPLYEFLGLSVGVIQHEMSPEERKRSYACDIVYGTNNEFGFDYLRDNMVVHKDDIVQRNFSFAIVDEVDSILIDESRTPLIISGATDVTNSSYSEMKPVVEHVARYQARLISELIEKLKKAISDEKKDEDLKKLLYIIHKGAPKDKDFLDIVLKNTKIKSIFDRAVSLYEGKLMENEKAALLEELFFVFDEKSREVTFTSKGENLMKDKFGVEFMIESLEDKLYAIANTPDITDEEKLKTETEITEAYTRQQRKVDSIKQLLKAYVLFRKDVEYVVHDNKVIIVDEFTGRMMPGRRFSEGIHEAIEAKEGVEVQRESQTLATVTLQNFFRMYDKLSGMTGTAATESAEFEKIYDLQVVVIPTNKELNRENLGDVIYKTEKEKFEAICNEIEKLSKIGRPVLVGTISIEKSETLSAMLKRMGVQHYVLNAKYHEMEAHIVAQAGRFKGVTIATNMAGRGTDILLGGNPEYLAEDAVSKLSIENAGEKDAIKKKYLDEYKAKTNEEHEKVVGLGGLHVLGTERHESRRVDNQLRGRSGRQGDPGSSRFYLSLEDDLMRIFGSDRIKMIMERLGMEEGQEIQHPLVSRAIRTAQKRVETQNFEIRKHLLKYDNVMTQQREVIYSRRRNIILNEDLKEEVFSLLEYVLEDWLSGWGQTEDFFNDLCNKLRLKLLININAENLDGITKEEALARILGLAKSIYIKKEKIVGNERTRAMEKMIMLGIIDSNWKDYLFSIDQLREGIMWRSYGQKDPLVEYQHEAFAMFSDLVKTVDENIIERLFKAFAVEERFSRGVFSERNEKFIHEEFSALQQGPPEQNIPKPMPDTRPGRDVTFVRSEPKVGRNDPCPCGSGRKYKKCCGK